MSTVTGRLTARLGVGGRELACVAGIVAAAAAFRFANLPVRGGWDSDQGTEMLALRDALATGRLPTFGPVSSLGNFHHDALSRDLILPAAWLGNGDPTWVVGEVALLGLLVVLAIWWIARSIAGTPAGLAAALLAAVSASLIGYSTFIWNPTPVEPGAALAYLGAWQAVRTQKAQLWILAAIGSAVAAQSHVAAAVILLPMAAAYALDLRRGSAVRRRSIVRWGWPASFSSSRPSSQRSFPRSATTSRTRAGSWRTSPARPLLRFTIPSRGCSSAPFEYWRGP
jgi:4-amino-4-deoxy-L-arabinose transferase-like glycosyltransferase